MKETITGIDHAIILVSDLDRAAATYRRLGFTLTERGHHTKLGTHNHCMMLQNDYLEILGVAEPAIVSPRWTEILADREGPVAAALATDDAEAAAAELARRGVAVGEAVRFARPVDLPDGRREARFVVTHLDPRETPGASMFFCEHLTRDVVWRPEWQRHKNGAIAIASLLAVHPQPAEAALRYERLVGADRVKQGRGRADVEFGRCVMTIVEPGDVEELSAGIAAAPSRVPARLVGMTLRVADLAQTRAHLKAAGVAHVEAPGRLVVPPAETHGVILGLSA